jgi:hypothetical protein
LGGAKVEGELGVVELHAVGAEQLHESSQVFEHGSDVGRQDQRIEAPVDSGLS